MGVEGSSESEVDDVAVLSCVVRSKRDREREERRNKNVRKELMPEFKKNGRSGTKEDLLARPLKGTHTHSLTLSLSLAL